MPDGHFNNSMNNTVSIKLDDSNNDCVIIVEDYLDNPPQEPRIVLGEFPVQLLVFTRSLMLIGYLDVNQFLDDFSEFVSFAGTLPAGVGWPLESRPSSPSVMTFKKCIKDY